MSLLLSHTSAIWCTLLALVAAHRIICTRFLHHSSALQLNGRYNMHADEELHRDLTSSDYKVVHFGNIDALIIKLLIKDVGTDELSENVFYLFLTCTVQPAPVEAFCRTRKVEGPQCDTLKAHLTSLLSEYRGKHFSLEQNELCRTIGRPYSSGPRAPGFDASTIGDEILLSSTNIYAVPSPIGMSIINPSMVSWNGKVLVSTRASVFGTSTKATSDVISFSLFDSFESFEDWVKGNLRGFFGPKHYTVEMAGAYGLGYRTYVTGEDARFVVIADKLFVVFNSINAESYPSRLMYYAQVDVTPEGRAVVVGKLCALDANLFTGFMGQKNWTPFDLNGRLAFSYSLFPHVVVEPVDHFSSVDDFSICESAWTQYKDFVGIGELLPETLLLRECAHNRLYKSPFVAPKTIKILGLSERFSASQLYLSSYKDMIENYLIFYDQIHEPIAIDDTTTLRYQNFSMDAGLLSGGSPSVRINATHYLGFFHSRFFDYSRSSLRYAMGAFLFSSAPPFRMVALMKAPMLPAVIQRALSESSPIDNVYYPAGIFLRGIDDVWLSLGHDDQRGFIAKYSLKELLSHMEVVQ